MHDRPPLAPLPPDNPFVAIPRAAPPRPVNAEPNVFGYEGGVTASRFTRFLARTVDGLISVVPLWLVTGVYRNHVIQRPLLMDPKAQALLLAYGWVLVAFGLQAVLISLRGQSIGKWVLGLRIVNRFDEPAGFVDGVLKRELVVFLSGWVPCAGPARALDKHTLSKWLKSPESLRAGPPAGRRLNGRGMAGLPNPAIPLPSFNRQKSEPQRARALA